MRADFGVDFECFASPMNAVLDGFCSAFPGIDGPFGSHGSFFAESFQPEAGCFEANPPFVVAVVNKLRKKISRLLGSAQEADRSLAFIVVLPSWNTDANTSEAAEGRRKAWEAFRSVPLCRHVETLEVGEHAFTVGMQHCAGRPTQLKEEQGAEAAWVAEHRDAAMPTSIFFLCTSRALQRWPITEDKLRRLRVAFSNPRKVVSVATDGTAISDRKQAATAAGLEETKRQARKRPHPEPSGHLGKKGKKGRKGKKGKKILKEAKASAEPAKLLRQGMGASGLGRAS